MKTIGDRLRSLRKQSGLSQEAVGKIIDTSDVTVGFWERDQHKPPLDKGYELAVLFGTTVEYIITGKGQSASALNLELLSNSIENVEKAAKALGRDIPPDVKASLVVARYGLGENPEFSDILDLFDPE